MIFVTMVCAKYGAAAIQDVRMIKQNTEKWRKSLSKKHTIYHTPRLNKYWILLTFMNLIHVFKNPLFFTHHENEYSSVI
jgi:hypothetical protein